MVEPISEAELDAMSDRANAATPGPWESSIEGRDHSSGDSFILTSDPDGTRSERDLYLTGGTDADQDFIAAARTDVPRLIGEVRRLKALIGTE